MSNIVSLPPTRAQIFGLTDEDFAECDRIDALLDLAFGKDVSLIPVDDMLTVITALIANLRRRITELERPVQKEG